MKDNFQTEDTLNNKEVEGSATENLKCLYLSTGYFAQPENFTTFFVVTSGPGSTAADQAVQQAPPRK